jgi:dipeptidyl-peptidase 4
MIVAIRTTVSLLASVFVLGAVTPRLVLAQPDVRARYERAAAIQRAQHDKWLLNQRISPYWIDDHRMWFDRETRGGKRYTLVDARTRRMVDLFDHGALARALDAALPDSVKVNAEKLDLDRVTASGDPIVVTFSAFGKHWRYSTVDNRLEEEKSKPVDPEWVVSPDGRRAILFKGPNLLLRDLTSGTERALTADGEPYYAYGASVDAGGYPASRPHIIWSPDSKRIITAQTDDRKVLDLPVINFVPKDSSLRPTIRHVRTALPGDANVTQFRMLAIDVETGKHVNAHYPTLPATRMNGTPMGENRVWWASDSRLAYFVEIERGEKRVNVVQFDTHTGDTRVLFSETASTYVDLASSVYGEAHIVPLPETNQLIWYSERSGWVHLYLYDLKDGRVVRQLTRGDWLVRDVVAIDRKRRELLLTVADRTKDKDPYYREVIRVSIDTGQETVLSASDADHVVQGQPRYGLVVEGGRVEGWRAASGMSPGGDYFVEMLQRPDRPARTVLRDRSGQEILTIEPGDTSGVPSWWRWPERVRLKAADRTTDISGVVFRPSDFSPGKRYPVVDYIYGGPQVSNVPENFIENSFTISATIAELGFVVVVIDGRGTSERSKAFHDASYAAMETASNVEDHIAGIRQLSKRYPYMDTTRVGIYGFSGGGYMTASAMLRFPDFFDVGVSAAGNHDQRLFWHTWGERYHGLVEGDNFKRQANSTYAKNFKGKMLFIHGMIDYGVHPSALFQLTQALMDANKDFDMLLLPQASHELPSYALRRMLDYFVVHLRGETPPKDFRFKTGRELMAEEAGAQR